MIGAKINLEFQIVDGAGGGQLVLQLHLGGLGVRFQHQCFGPFAFDAMFALPSLLSDFGAGFIVKHDPVGGFVVETLAVLLAAHLLSPTQSADVAALVGTYVANGAGAVNTLTLAADATATLVSVTPDGATTVETGSWLLEGATVQIAFMNVPGAGGATATTLEVRDGSLVARRGDDGALRFAGLTFEKS